MQRSLDALKIAQGQSATQTLLRVRIFNVALLVLENFKRAMKTRSSKYIRTSTSEAVYLRMPGAGGK